MNTADPRKGEHPDWGTKVFDYGKNEVIQLSDRQRACTGSMNLPCRRPARGRRRFHALSGLWTPATGQWVPNKYGDNKNLEAIEFFKHLNSVLIRGRNHRRSS